MFATDTVTKRQAEVEHPETVFDAPLLTETVGGPDLS
jgi:hypothetical protein